MSEGNREEGKPFVVRLLRSIWRKLTFYGEYWARVPDDDPPATYMFARLPAGHPERLCPEGSLSLAEQELARELADCWPPALRAVMDDDQ